MNEVDHSQEVRALVNDLQTAARDARARAAIVEQERDDLAARLAEAKTQLSEVRQQFVEISSLLRERDDAVGRGDRFEKEAREAHAHLETLAKDYKEAIRGRDENAKLARESSRVLDDLQRQVRPIREARDTAQATNLHLNRKLQELRDDLVFAHDERDIAKEELKKADAALDTLRQELTTRKAGISEEERGELVRQINDLRQTLIAKDAEIERLTTERQQVQQSDRTSELEKDVAKLRAEVAKLETEKTAAVRKMDSVADKADQAEAQRLCAIDLAAQLENAKRDLIALAANLAEARLQNKSNQSKLVSRALTGSNPSSPEMGKTGSAPELLAAAEPAPAVFSAADVFSEKEAKAILTVAKQCYQSFTRDPSDLSLVNELHCHMHQFAERSRISGFVALHRLTYALSYFTQELYRSPESINSGSMRTLQQSIDFLGVLIKQPDYSSIKDPSTALVYSVDDEVEICEALRLAMESVGMRLRAATEPVVALSELATTHFDLIFLDVNLPNMDGFELCQHIRNSAVNSRAPVVFLTGLTSIENQVQSSLSGGDDFVTKPFSLNELSVKALMLILKASLNE